MNETLDEIRRVFIPDLIELNMCVEEVATIGMIPTFTRVHEIAQMANSPVFALSSSAKDVNRKGL